MTKRNSRTSAVATGALIAIGLLLCGGCTPSDSAEIETFMRDLLLNAGAAFLL